jgi:hypothetical protein
MATGTKSSNGERDSNRLEKIFKSPFPIRHEQPLLVEGPFETRLEGGASSSQVVVAEVCIFSFI